ncbi:MAG: DNA cytosine methyltransferase [Myxococcales bacterium]|nr:DNA cytosine methyltransferase [Myxococcales bacterium]MCA9639299.1 DNA cytosine methyltransferase [Myxococcales bacterium]
MRRPKVISLFSGAGGLDYGFEAAGFTTSVALEIDADSCASLRASRPRRRVINEDIFAVTTKQLLETANLRAGEADVLIGGPPCQPFSKAGYWARGDSARLNDPRANTLAAYMSVVEEALPAVFLLENVEGLAFAGKDEGWKFLLAQIEGINRRTKSDYAPVMKKLDAAHYGVPQHRERVIIVAARSGEQFRFPEPTHGDTRGDGPLFASQLDRYRTAWDAIGDVQPDPSEVLDLRGKWAALLPSIPEGSNYLHHTDRGEGLPLFGWRRRFWTFLLKLAKNRPSWTLQAQPGPAVGPFHWSNRRLSTRELCRLQTFPDDVIIKGGRTSIQRQLGNAVPSLLGEVLGRAISTQLLGRRRLTSPLRLLPPDRSPAPSPEPVMAVPSELARLAGKHAAHPGTGKGYGAAARAEAAT